MAKEKWPSRRSLRVWFFHDTKRGDLSEQLVDEALQILMNVGEIHHYIPAERGGELDRQGIDCLVFPESDWAIPLQIKSSFRGRKEHYNRYGNRIPCIVVCLSVTPFELSGLILRELGLSVKPLEEFLMEVLEEIVLDSRSLEIDAAWVLTAAAAGSP